MLIYYQDVILIILDRNLWSLTNIKTTRMLNALQTESSNGFTELPNICISFFGIHLFRLFRFEFLSPFVSESLLCLHTLQTNDNKEKTFKYTPIVT